MNFIFTYQKTGLFILGLLSALLFAPVNFAPVGFLAISLLLILIDRSNSRHAFYLGWFFAFGHFTIGFYWVSISLFVDISRFWWLLPFSLSLIPLHTMLSFVKITKLARKSVLNVSFVLDIV